MTTLLYKIPAIIALLLILASCSGDDKAIMPEPETPGRLVMYVTTGDALPAQSKATPSDGSYLPGESYENYIDIESGDFAVWLFDSQNRLVMKPSQILLIPIENDLSNPFSKTYRLEICFNATEWETYRNTFYGSELKVVMLTNWRNYPALQPGQTIDQLTESVENILPFTPVSPYIDYHNRIPCFGILSKHNPVLTEGSALNVGSLHLLRALAKIEIYNRDESSTITEVTLDKYNTKINCAPAGVYSPDDYIHGSWSLDYTSVPSIPQAAERHDAPFKLTPDSNGHFVAYIPEYRNIGRPENERMALHVKFQGVTNPYTVEFKNYVTGQPIDAMRNTWYKFAVRIGFVSLQVQPYSAVDLEPEFGLARDEDGDLMVLPDAYGNYPAQFLEIYASHLEKIKDLKLQKGDYYCIIRSSTDKREDDLLCIKDADCCRVLENFHAFRPECPGVYEERKVWQFRSRLNIDRQYYKDRDRDELLQHNTDHSLVVRSHLGELFWKTKDGSKRIPVESWDKNTGLYWVEAETQYIEYDRDGNKTGNTVSK